MVERFRRNPRRGDRSSVSTAGRGIGVPDPPGLLLEVVRPDGVDERVAVSGRIPDQLETEPAATRAWNRRHAPDVGGAPRPDQVDTYLSGLRRRACRAAVAAREVAAVAAPSPDDLD